MKLKRILYLHRWCFEVQYAIFWCFSSEIQCWHKLPHTVNPPMTLQMDVIQVINPANIWKLLPNVWQQMHTARMWCDRPLIVWKIHLSDLIGDENLSLTESWNFGFVRELEIYSYLERSMRFCYQSSQILFSSWSYHKKIMYSIFEILWNIWKTLSLERLLTLKFVSKLKRKTFSKSTLYKDPSARFLKSIILAIPTSLTTYKSLLIYHNYSFSVHTLYLL